MAPKKKMALDRLSDVFPAASVEWRMGHCGKTSGGRFWGMCLAYITNRAIMDRLDEVVGRAGWFNEFKAAPDGGVLCGLSIIMEDGSVVTKWDGAQNSIEDPIKGGLSGAMKRAGVQWGIGRYLYDLEAGWANIHPGGSMNGQTKQKERFRWDPPLLPKWALPAGDITQSIAREKEPVVIDEKPATPKATKNEKTRMQIIADKAHCKDHAAGLYKMLSSGYPKADLKGDDFAAAFDALVMTSMSGVEDDKLIAAIKSTKAVGDLPERLAIQGE